MGDPQTWDARWWDAKAQAWGYVIGPQPRHGMTRAGAERAAAGLRALHALVEVVEREPPKGRARR